VSTDGGKTFTDFPPFINPDTTVGYEHQFPNVSVNRAGNVTTPANPERVSWIALQMF